MLNKNYNKTSSCTRLTKRALYKIDKTGPRYKMCGNRHNTLVHTPYVLLNQTEAGDIHSPNSVSSLIIARNYQF